MSQGLLIYSICYVDSSTGGSYTAATRWSRFFGDFSADNLGPLRDTRQRGVPIHTPIKQLFIYILI